MDKYIRKIYIDEGYNNPIVRYEDGKIKYSQFIKWVEDCCTLGNLMIFNNKTVLVNPKLVKRWDFEFYEN